MSRMRWTAICTFDLKCHMVCFSVILSCYRMTCFWFCNRRFGIDYQLIRRGRYLGRALYISQQCTLRRQPSMRRFGTVPSVAHRSAGRGAHRGLLVWARQAQTLRVGLQARRNLTAETNMTMFDFLTPHCYYILQNQWCVAGCEFKKKPTG